MHSDLDESVDVIRGVRRGIVAGLLMLVLVVQAAAGDATGEFEAYPPEAALSGPAAKPIVNAGRARQYRTILTEEAAEGANFNGHYRIVQWGCGANCLQWAVIDLTSGDVWFAPESLGSCFTAGERLSRVREWIEFYPTSRLIYAHDCSGQSTQGTFDARLVYEWQSGSAVLLRVEEGEF